MANPQLPLGASQDRYEVREFLSEGGMGAIYRGVKRGAGGFDRPVVLKQLLPEYTEQPEFIELFLREAKLTASLDHANIVQTIDLVNAGQRGQEYFIVMEYIEGADVRTLLKKTKRRRSRLSPAAAIYIAREVLSALAYAHDKRDADGQPLDVIHRDVSPSNILVSATGEVKLTDFGIAKASTHHSVFYRVRGKIGYMSPEQARSQPLDRRSDLYAVAVCLYEMLSGEKLFVNSTLTASVEDMYAQPIPLVSRKVSGLPADMDKLMLKALSLDPAARYQTAAEFQEALIKVAHRHGFQMSASELGPHLEVVCGPADKWRDLDDNKDLPEKTAHHTGTDLYAFAPDDPDDDDMEGDGDHSGNRGDRAGYGGANKARRNANQGNPFAGVELTSIIPSEEGLPIAQRPLQPPAANLPPLPMGFAPGEDTGILVMPATIDVGGHGKPGSASTSANGGAHASIPRGQAAGAAPNAKRATAGQHGPPGSSGHGGQGVATSSTTTSVAQSMITNAVVVHRSIKTRLANLPRWAIAVLVAVLFVAIVIAVGFSGPTVEITIPTLPKRP